MLAEAGAADDEAFMEIPAGAAKACSTLPALVLLRAGARFVLFQKIPTRAD
jgi:hypothetical protein